MKTKRKTGRVSVRIPLAAIAVAAGLMQAERAHAQTLLFDNLSNWDNGVSGSSALYYSGAGDTFVGGAYILPTGTTQLTGFDLEVDNGTNASTGSTYTSLQINAYIWGAVNTTTALSSSTPAFSNLLDEVSGTVSIGGGGLPPGGYYVPLETGSPGTTPFFTFNSPLNLPAGVTTVGITFNVEGSTDGTNYASATGLTPLVTYGSGPTAGGEYTVVYFNVDGETNGNFISGPYTFNQTDNVMGLRLYGNGSFGADQWSNGAGGPWETGSNWTTGSAPTATGDASFNLSSSGYTVSINQADACRNLFVQNDNVTINITTLLSSLTMSQALSVGNNGSTGTLNLQNASGFSVNVSAGSIVVGGNSGTGTLTVGTYVNLVTTGTTTVGAGSSLNISGGKLLIPSLSLAGSVGAWTGKLDVGTGSLDLSSASLATVTNQAKQGYNKGTWNASGGITSTAANADTMHLTAVGVISNNVSGTALYSSTSMLGMFEGLNSGLNDVLVKYTYYGDANLDGQVDGSDYSLVDATYLAEHFVKGVPTTAISGWYNGDFNYDGVVDGSDYTLMDNAYNMQGDSLAPDISIGSPAGGSGTNSGIAGTPISGAETPLGRAGSPGGGVVAYSDQSIASPTAAIGSASVPEPTALALAGIGAISLLRRRSRRVDQV